MDQHYLFKLAMFNHAQLTVLCLNGKNGLIAQRPVRVDNNPEPELSLQTVLSEDSLVNQLLKAEFAIPNHAPLTVSLEIG